MVSFFTDTNDLDVSLVDSGSSYNEACNSFAPEVELDGYHGSSCNVACNVGKDEGGKGGVGGSRCANTLLCGYGEGSTVVRCNLHSVLAHVVDLGGDAHAVCGTWVMMPGHTLYECEIRNGSTVRVLYRLRGGASGNMDIQGQWQCRVCDAQRCWLTRKRCYRCDPFSGLWVEHHNKRGIMFLLRGIRGHGKFLLGTSGMRVGAPQGQVWVLERPLQTQGKKMGLE